MKLEREKEREKKKEILERERLHLISRIPDDWTFGFRRGKKQSYSPRQGLRMGTGFVEF